MDREIKFRALKDDMSNCNFMYGQLVYDAIGQPRITDIDKSGQGLTFHTCFKGTEGQYTGLKDKNGKEIYEGDILRVIYGTGKVEFHAGCFMIVWIDDKEANMELLSMSDYKRGAARNDVEIIGNIHENTNPINKTT